MQRRRSALGLDGGAGAADGDDVAAGSMADGEEAVGEDDGEDDGEDGGGLEVGGEDEDEDGGAAGLALAPMTDVEGAEGGELGGGSAATSAVARYVYESAVAAMPEDVELRLGCLRACGEVEAGAPIQAAIETSLRDSFGERCSNISPPSPHTSPSRPPTSPVPSLQCGRGRGIGIAAPRPMRRGARVGLGARGRAPRRAAVSRRVVGGGAFGASSIGGVDV